MAVMTAERLGATVGARVDGVDVDTLVDDESVSEWCLEALEANGVLVFRGLHLDDASQVAFSRKLGTVEVPSKGAEHPEIFLVTLDPAKSRTAQYLRGTFDWHIDGCTDDVPIMATMLSAHAVADSGGETEFASSYAAYDDLTDDEKERFESVRVVHSLEAAQRLTNPDPSEKELAIWRSRPPKEHPLVWRHRSGRRSLVVGATASHVVGMDRDEGRALLAELVDRATVPDRVYRHEWAVGDVVIWDNRGVLHRALPYDQTSPREMHRTTFAGDEPIQ
jgi:alpha-ketoglutarate-dependent taurine dioxygenase